MFDLGFKHFVGVDGSKGILEQAAKSGLYRELKLALLGADPLPAQTGTPHSHSELTKHRPDRHISTTDKKTAPPADSKTT